MKYLLKIFIATRNLWPYFIAVSLSTIAVALLNLASPFILKFATDAIVEGLQSGGVDVQYIMWLAIAFFVVDFAVTLIVNGGGYLGDVMAERMRKQLSNAYYEQLLSLSQRYYDKELTGTIINRLNRTITEVTRFINAVSNNFGSMLLTVVFVLIVLFVYSWELALMLVVLYPLFLGLTAMTSKRWQKWMTKRNEQIDIASGRFAEVVSGVRVVKSFVRERTELQLFDRHFGRNVELTREQSNYWHRMDILRRSVLNVLFAGMYMFIFVGTANQRFSLGDMVLLLQMLNLARQPIFGISFLVDQTQRAIAGSRDYFEVMGIKPAITDKKHATTLDVNDGTVVYEDIRFGYTRKQEVLKGVSFSVQAGEKVALVGESGEGKSTVTSLLLRLYAPNSGAIMIDGQNIADVTQTSLRERIAVVFQEPTLFSGTIRENIAYGKPGATKADIEAAARAANAYDFIAKLDKQFDTEIGERGLKLSGGQKQRLAIARAILKDAPILILDEATSSLDSRAEKQVQEALDRLMRGRTTLIIAHRLSTIAGVDRIVTLRDGAVDEIGTPAELAKTNGIYAQLLELQLGDVEKAKKNLAKYDIAA